MHFLCIYYIITFVILLYRIDSIPRKACAFVPSERI
nr:MAG TPA: hypothetical protein [Caudoviricetes sp.]